MTKPIVFIGEAMGANEVKIGRGFVGTSGIELLKMLAEANVITFTTADRTYLSNYYSSGDPNQIDMIWNLHPELYRTNVFQQHPPGNNLEAFCGGKAEGIAGFPALVKGKFVRKEFEYELDRLGDEILAIDPNLIVCLGNSALWALAGRTGVSKLRGTTLLSTHTVINYKLMCTYHPAAVTRQWEIRPTTIIDLAKIPLEATFPEIRRPKREIWIEPTLSDIERFINDHIIGCRMLSIDIETAGSQITCVGFAPRSDLAIVIPIHDERTASRSYWPTKELELECWKLIRRVLEDGSIPKVLQNGLYDIAFCWRSYGIRVMGASDDSMLLHHALQPESLKALGFLGSVYLNERAWKVERKGQENTIKRDA